MVDQIKNVFISHVFEDNDGLKKLQDLASSRGLIVRDSSIDAENRNNAKNDAYIKSEILAPRINWASVLVVYVTPATKHSDYVNWEIEYAHRLGKRVVGVWAHGAANTDLPEALERYADSVVAWNAEGVVDAICGEDKPWTGPTGAPRGPRVIARYSC